ncbi:MAG: hypothetical protein WC058_05260 [Phycisphaeraceae bacterium]
MSVAVTMPMIAGLGPGLTMEQSRAIYRQGEETAVFALLQQAQQIGTLQPSVAAAGPAGRVARRRSVSTQTREHRESCCPDCGGPLKRCDQTCRRYIEDIPRDIAPGVTEHMIHRDYCPQCKKQAAGLVIRDG